MSSDEYGPSILRPRRFRRPPGTSPTSRATARRPLELLAAKIPTPHPSFAPRPPAASRSPLRWRRASPVALGRVMPQQRQAPSTGQNLHVDNPRTGRRGQRTTHRPRRSALSTPRRAPDAARCPASAGNRLHDESPEPPPVAAGHRRSVRAASFQRITRLLPSRTAHALAERFEFTSRRGRDHRRG